MPVDTEEREIDHLLAGAVDTHMHTAPGAFPRHDTDFSAARAARASGLDAIVIKNHHFPTAGRAWIAREELGYTVLGGITLNEWVGGLSSLAIDGIAHFEPSIVWMPTISAANHVSKSEISMFEGEHGEKTGITVLNDAGDLTPDAHAVLDRVAEHELVVGLSHLSPTEAITLVEAAVNRGVEECLVQHPHAEFLDYSDEEMATITRLGATLEFHYICTTEMMGHAATIEDYVSAMEHIGPENCVMATDGGATANQPAMEMFETFVRGMLHAGVDEADIEIMIKDNPRRIFDLE